MYSSPFLFSLLELNSISIIPLMICIPSAAGSDSPAYTVFSYRWQTTIWTSNWLAFWYTTLYQQGPGGLCFRGSRARSPVRSVCRLSAHRLKPSPLLKTTFRAHEEQQDFPQWVWAHVKLKVPPANNHFHNYSITWDNRIWPISKMDSMPLPRGAQA
jgi:hypothetical protein